MNWTKADMFNVEVPPEELGGFGDRAWRAINRTDHIAYQSDMAVS
jgi:hypothetical protein